MKQWFLILPLSVACTEPTKEETETEFEVDDDTLGCNGIPIGLEAGMCAPEFLLPNTEDEMTSLSSFQGNIALVDISAVW